jgi:exosortase B
MTDGPRAAELAATLPSPHRGGIAFALVALAVAVLFGPTYARLSQTLWLSDEHSHGPLILAVCAYLMFRRRAALAALPAPPWRRTGPAWALLAASMALLAIGRAASMPLLELLAQPFAAAALLLIFKGTAGLRLMAFPVAFLVFSVPLPGVLVAAVTAPLKLAVSAVSTSLLHAVGYPIARQGVVLTVGPYQLLVADACAGLNSVFMLEALVLLYTNLMGYRDRWRNAFLILAAVPISFAANVVRVVTLVMVTFHFGDAAGRGFVHDFAGVLLLLVALFFTAGADRLYGLAVRNRP